MIDRCHLDEAGCALTVPTTDRWSVHGARLRVPDQAPQGRRVNVSGAYFTPGPDAGHVAYRSWAVLPTSRATTPRTTPEERAAAQGLTVEEGGPLAAERLVAFLWPVAGRPADAAPTWRRVCPLVIARDNDSVHPRQIVHAAQPALAVANVTLVDLARYCPAHSGIAPLWNAVKQHQIPIRRCAEVADRTHAVDAALGHQAHLLHDAYAKPTNIQRLAA